MIFNYILKNTLPKSAWLAHIINDEDTVTIFHGTSVEVQDNFFVEGAWDSDFVAGDFDNAISFLGSGGKITDDNALIFAAPSHIYERLYTLKIENQLFVSNSLVFIMSKSGDELDEEHPDYAKTLYRTYGMTKSDKSIPTRDKNNIRLYYYSNLEIRPNLEILEIPKKTVKKFSDFKSYKSFLSSSVTNIFKNANDPARKIIFNQPVTTISSGYDSTATAVLSRTIGCKDALTFKQARPLEIDQYRSGEDSGKRIAEDLGMDCYEFDRFDYLKSERQYVEAEIFATSHLVDLNMLSLESSLNDSTILFTGFRGDIMWDRLPNHNQDSGGPGMAEFRLRLGFIHFPLPYLGISHCDPTRCQISKSVRKISNSKEMIPWSIGGDYDRPIPRRIAEDAGVGRGSFAQENKAAAVWYGKEPSSDIMTKESFDDFQNFRSKINGPESNQCVQWGVARIKNRYIL